MSGKDGSAPAPPAPAPAGQDNQPLLEPIAHNPASAAAPAPVADRPAQPGTAVDPLIVPQSAQHGCLPLEPWPVPPPNGDPNYWGKKAGENEVQPAQPDPAADVHDVIVVGGGLSGLSCAFRVLDSATRELGLKAGERPKVIVLESAAKLGGRTRSADPWPELTKVDPHAGHISYGGTWVMFDNHELLSLSWDLDHLPFQPKLFPNFSTYAVNWRLLVLHPYLMIKLRTLGSRIWNAKPGTAEYAELIKYDKMPVEQWLEENAAGLPFPEHAKQAVRDWCYQGENFPTQPEHLWYMSTWFLARMIYIRLSHFAQTGTFFSKIMRWENGTGEIITRLTRKIRELGGYCYTEQRVDSCVTREDHVEVTVSVGPEQKKAVYRARRVVMAGAPHSSTRITYLPDPLPRHYLDFGEAFRLWDDTGTQVVLAWQTRWWDKKWRSVVMLPPPDDEQQGVYGACMDLSDHGPSSIHNYLEVNKHPLPPGVGVLRILVKSSRLKNPDGTMWDTDRVRESAFQYLAKEGLLNINDMRKGFLKCWVWNHEWNPDTLGTAFFAPPTTTARYAVSTPECSKPWGRFHFAGSERAPRGAQWMDGAVYMGQHKAPEVLEALYPGRYRHDVERQAYKRRIAAAEEHAIELLRQTLPSHKFLYFFEMILRWVGGNIRNVWHNLIEWREERWTSTPDPLPANPKFELATRADAAAVSLQQGEWLYAPNGRFGLHVSDHGDIQLIHRIHKHHDHNLVWSAPSPSVQGRGPYRLVLQPTGDLHLVSDHPDHKADAPIWASGSATPKGLYVSFRLLLGDDRGLNIYGYYPNGSRQIIWSAHTQDIHFSRPSLRDEVVKKHDKLRHFHSALAGHKPMRGYRKPDNDTEKEILTEMFKQQSKEKSYGQLMTKAHVDLEHRAREHMEAHVLSEGQVLREGQGLLSPHESHRLHIENGDLVITHKKTHGFHPVHPWEEKAKWSAGVTGKDARLEITHEGELKLYHGEKLAWSTPKPLKLRSPFRLYIHDDCNAVLYDSHLRPVWASDTACDPDVPLDEFEHYDD